MVKIAKSLDKDVNFLAKLRVLQQHIVMHDTLPNHINDKKLYNFIVKLRQKYRQNPNLSFWEWRVPMLLELGVDVTAAAAVQNKASPSNIEPNWRNALNAVRAILDGKQLNEDLAWFYAIMHQSPKQKRHKTLQELIVKWIQVGTICPSECTRSQPTYELRHTLSYICRPLSFVEATHPLAPFWRLKDCHDHCKNIAELPTWTVPFRHGNTVYFESDSFKTELFQGALRELRTGMDDGVLRF